MDYETGRATTPLIDLTTGAPYFYLARGVYPAIRRNANDFYTEGDLLWLDVDTILRERSHGAHSLDTFLHRFTEPGVHRPDRFDVHARSSRELVERRRTVRLARLFREIRLPSGRASADGRARTRRLAHRLYRSPNAFITAGDADDGTINGWYGFGADVAGSDAKGASLPEGVVRDVREGSAAWQRRPRSRYAVTGGQRSGVFGRRARVRAQTRRTFAGADHIHRAPKRTGTETLSLDYHGGIRYPHLERIAGTSDMLAAIAAPHAKSP